MGADKGIAEVLRVALDALHKQGMQKQIAKQAAKSAGKETKSPFQTLDNFKKPSNDWGGIAPDALAAMGASALAPPVVSDLIDPVAAGGGMSPDQEAYLARQPMQPWVNR